MWKLVQAVGGLLALGFVAESFAASGQDRDYTFTFRTVNGALVVDKSNPNGPYVLSTKHQTRFNFVNATTNPPSSVAARIFEPASCHVDFKPGNGCRSDVVTIEPTKKDKISVSKDAYDGLCKAGVECDFNIQVKLTSASSFTDIDPKLQIEDGGLRVFPDITRWVLIGLAIGLIVARLIFTAMRRRQAGGQP